MTGMETLAAEKIKESRTEGVVSEVFQTRKEMTDFLTALLVGKTEMDLTVNAFKNGTSCVYLEVN